MLEYRPDRWSPNGWRWVPSQHPQAYFHRSILATARPPGLSVSVDAAHRVMVPDRWSPTGWKLVAEGFQTSHLQRRNRRSTGRGTGDYQTTSSLAYSPPKHLPAQSLTFPEVPTPSSPSKQPTKPLNTEEFLRSRQWPVDPLAGKFHKTKHKDSGWVRMQLSGGNIR